MGRAWLEDKGFENRYGVVVAMGYIVVSQITM